ncbi:hypothetical protein C1I97_38175 [Streptomyces sp. NTH33]|nr:hypothetical protein C1I97_38175 [Streptomyces sp. NTH33]
MMVLLSGAGLTADEIGELLGYHPATVRRWIHRYHADGPAGLADRPRSGRPRLGGAPADNLIHAGGSGFRRRPWSPASVLSLGGRWRRHDDRPCC